MAAESKRLATNVMGDFYVDNTCIDCAACRWVAPLSFEESGDYSRVFHQPIDPGEILRAEMALIACPTGSIGTVAKHDLKVATASLPEPLADNVYYCGYHAESSFGAASYLIQRPDGNLMIDSPRYAGPLVKRLHALGGVAALFLTHRDDVADHVQWRDAFGSERIIHQGDAVRTLRDLEHLIDGEEPVQWSEDIVIIPTPGHTKGSACLLYRDKFLFTGDHLAWSPARGHLYAFRDACWYDWVTQIRSMERLLDYRFEWVLPGHGYPVQLPADQMRKSLETCIAWMKAR